MQAISLVPRRGVDERPLTRNPSPDVQRQKLKPREKPVWLDGKVAVWRLHPVSAGELVYRIGEAHALRVATDVLDHRVGEDEIVAAPGDVGGQTASVGLVRTDPGRYLDGLRLQVHDVHGSRMEWSPNPCIDRSTEIDY